MTFTIIAILILLLMSAFFSSSETALTGASQARIHTLAKNGDKRAQRVNKIWNDPDGMIGSILLGNNLVNTMATALATALLIQMFGENGIFAATVIMTILVVLFSEILPKTYAYRHSDNWALWVSRPMQYIIWLFNPIAKIFSWIVNQILKLFNISDNKVNVGYEELRGIIDLHSKDKESGHMLRSILDLEDVTVEEVMIHRKHAITIEKGSTIDHILGMISDNPYTRYAVWEKNHDNIVGVLDIHKLYPSIFDKKPDETIDTFIEPAWFIPEHTKLTDQLQAFRNRSGRMAIVVDEYGEFMGIVTLSDILEEIVGDISTHDNDIPSGIVDEKTSIIVDGMVTIRDLNRKFDWKFPDDQASTVAGLVLTEIREIPDSGQTFDIHGHMFHIMERKRNQITKIRITKS